MRLLIGLLRWVVSNICLLLTKMIGGRKGPSTFTLSGTITGDEVEGATITLTGDASDSTTSAADGTYSFTGLVDGSYTVTPSLTLYGFTPSSASVEVSGADNTGNDFVSVVSPGYIEGGWEDGVSVPAFGAQPEYDWALFGDTPSSITNVSSPTLLTYTPAQSRSILFDYGAPDASSSYRWVGLQNASLVLPKASGIRAMFLAGWGAGVDDQRLELYLINAAGTHWIRARWQNDSNPDAVGIREYFNSGAYDNETTSTMTDTSATEERWCAVGLEIPANISGTATARIVTLGTGGATKEVTRTINQDWSSVDLVGVQPSAYKDGGGSPYIAWVWAGTVADDWPI